MSVCVLTVRQVHHDSTGQSTQHSFIEIEGPMEGFRGRKGLEGKMGFRGSKGQ